MRLLRFREDPDPVRFQDLYGAVLLAIALEERPDALLELGRLRGKLDVVSIPDVQAAQIGGRYPRFAPLPCTVQLTEAEHELLVWCFQHVVWDRAVVDRVIDTTRWLTLAPPAT